MAISIIIIALIIIADRLVKYWAMTALAPVGEIAGIDGVFHFYYTKNTGAAFSLLQNHTWILIAVTGLIALVALYVLFFKKLNPVYNVFLAFVAAGGIANLIDRIAYGYVVDMFMVDFVRFAIFNVADIFITIGGIGIIIVLLFFDTDNRLFRPKKKAEETQEESGAESAPQIRDK